MSKNEITSTIAALTADKQNALQKIKGLRKAREIVAENINIHADAACVEIDACIYDWTRVVEIAESEIKKEKKRLKLIEQLEALDNE